jgi:hypothetical protein
MRHLNLLAICTLLTISLVAGTCTSKEKADSQQHAGIIFGSFNICCKAAYFMDYRLRLRRVGEKRPFPLSVVSHDRMGGHYTFLMRLPAGKYYFWKFGARQVDYENPVFTEERPFEVIEGKAIYLGEWHFDLLPQTTSFSVHYDKERVKDFLDRNREYSSDDVLIAVHGKSSMPISPEQIPDTN